MGKLHYVTNVSLDGYIEDATGDFSWSVPDDEYFAFITDLIRPATTYLYGRKLYESMAVWETDPSLAAASALQADFADVWQRADKIVYSTTLETPATDRTRIERAFDADAVRATKAATDAVFTVGGAELAAHAFRAGLVDECQLFVHPAVVGGGKPGLPREYGAKLELLEQRSFPSGAVFVRYAVVT